MIYYVTLGTNDLQRAEAFYDRVMPTLGLVRSYENPAELSYGPQGAEPILWVGPPYDKGRASFGNGAMLAFTATTRDQVDAAHAAAMATGGSDEGPPGLRRYGPHFYACYFRDPDGNKISIVCQAAEPA
jgi:catechol 2,3-dioxygenase-like lactoylglutathione lyase family enzyme